jgi:hypothetical protein
MMSGGGQTPEAFGTILVLRQHRKNPHKWAACSAAGRPPRIRGGVKELVPVMVKEEPPAKMLTNVGDVTQASTRSAGSPKNVAGALLLDRPPRLVRQR